MKANSRIYAFEGINASGKSSVLKLLQQQLLREGINARIFKVSGIGSGPKMACLGKILEYRETLLREGSLSKKQESDRLRDRLLRIANRIQVREFLHHHTLSPDDIHLLDRTPLMSWAYTSSIPVENPYIGEVRDESLRLTKLLGIGIVFLLEISPITVYARIIHRSLEIQPVQLSEVKELLNLVDAPVHIKQGVLDEVISIADQNLPTSLKKRRIWDFMPYVEVCRQVDNYRAVVEVANATIGIQFVRIDASKSLHDIVSEIRGYIGYIG